MLDKNFIEAVYERDIDLLLLEEMYSSTEFQDWLINKVFGTGNVAHKFQGAWHSVTDSELGESDLVFIDEVGKDKQRAILIENKIDAPFQPNQARRYRQRGEKGIGEDSWQEFRTLLIAPQKYLDSTSNTNLFDFQLSYEQIRDWFASMYPQNSRVEYRIKFLNEAIEQNRRGYQPVPDEAATRFWYHYWNFVQSQYPSLDMKKPGVVPAFSDWPEFRNEELGRGNKIVHKLYRGIVDLHLEGMGKKVDGLREMNRYLLEDGIEVTGTKKTAFFRKLVSKVDKMQEFTEQLDEVQEGLEAAVYLLELYPKIRLG